jgi:hypothetical protein
MEHNTLVNLQQLVGKVCSIITAKKDLPITRIQGITKDGIFGVDPHHPDLLNFYMFEHIISIHEELELHPDNPAHAEIIQSLEKKQVIPEEDEPVEEKKPNVASFIDINELTNLAKTTRQTYETLDFKQNLR